jgi:hypothetical protein
MTNLTGKGITADLPSPFVSNASKQESNYSQEESQNCKIGKNGANQIESVDGERCQK